MWFIRKTEADSQNGGEVERSQRLQIRKAATGLGIVFTNPKVSHGRVE